MKFRVWNKIKKTFDNIGYIWYNPLNENFCYAENNIHYNISEDNKSPKYIVQQFTGLKDKNGEEIFEGDIILSYPDHSDGYVAYDEKIGAFVMAFGRLGKPLDPDECLFFSNGGNCNPQSKKCKIIGNIFENPELLKD